MLFHHRSFLLLSFCSTKDRFFLPVFSAFLIGRRFSFRCDATYEPPYRMQTPSDRQTEHNEDAPCPAKDGPHRTRAPQPRSHDTPADELSVDEMTDGECQEDIRTYITAVHTEHQHAYEHSERTPEQTVEYGRDRAVCMHRRLPCTVSVRTDPDERTEQTADDKDGALFFPSHTACAYFKKRSSRPFFCVSFSS